jgi:methionyl-tRNA formyltransferase
MKILFCAYRDWAKDVFFRMCKVGEPNQFKITLVTNPQEMETLSREKEWDAIIMVGWSWKTPTDIVNSRRVIVMHPSDLPDYAGGSPIQNQILDGITKTRATLFKANEKFDEGEIVDKEPISLVGHLDDVLQSISDASAIMVLRFLKNFPDNTYTKQEGERHKVKRLKPEHSRLPMPVEISKTIPDDYGNVDEIIERKLTCQEMWDHIRCREDPYPNAYFEDETGKLIIKRVEFEPK